MFASCLLLLAVLAISICSKNSLVFACVSGSCKNGMCSDIPSNNEYYLTSFCDKSVACGSFSGNCNEWYSADYSRFGCGSMISCCKGSNCVNLKVIDGGPGCSVEDSAHKQIVDASYSTCKHFTGSTSCGWSDKISIVCKKTSYTYRDSIEANEGGKIPLGPCSYNQTFAAENSVPICGFDMNLF
eukprot:gene29454-35552_t